MGFYERFALYFEWKRLHLHHGKISAGYLLRRIIVNNNLFLIISW
jgi:hypothetical protein